MAILVILAGGYKALLELRRQRTANRIGRRVLEVPLEGDFADSSSLLLGLRAEIRERVRRRWWRLGELDKPRWRRLDELIEEQVAQARANLARTLVTELRSLLPVPATGGDEPIRRCRAIERRIWKCLEAGELDSSQHSMLLGLVEKCREQASDADSRTKSTGNHPAGD